MLRPLSHRNYRLWAAADVVSITGTWMQVLGLNWLLLTATGSATAAGLAVLLQSVPVLLLGGWGGALADRLPARPVLIAAQASRALVALTLAGTALAGATALWPIYVATLCSGVIGAIEGPVLGRFGSTLVPREVLGSALGLGSVLTSGGRILGMALGGILAGTAGPAPLFLVNAVSFGAVIAALAAMRPAEMHPLATAPAGSAEAGVRAGLRYLRREPVILVILALAFMLGGLGRNYQITMAAMSAGPLDAGAAGYGLLSTAFAVGGVLGGLVAASRRRMSLRLLLVSGTAISLLQFGSGFAPDLVAFAVAIVPIAAGAVIVDTVVSARIQLDTREDMRGRMIAALALASSLAGMVGAPLLGRLADTVGARGSLVLAGALTTAACLAGATVLSRLRSVPLLPAAVVPVAAAVGPVTASVAGRARRLHTARRLRTAHRLSVAHRRPSVPEPGPSGSRALLIAAQAAPLLR